MAQERYLIFYSSRTGNTKMLADAIREAYYRKVLERVRQSVDESNTIVGTYMCQGKMPQSVRDRYVKMKEKPDHAPNLDELIQNFDRALSHPDNEDLERLEEIIRRDLEK